jgi:hypothetical protein
VKTFWSKTLFFHDGILLNRPNPRRRASRLASPVRASQFPRKLWPPRRPRWGGLQFQRAQRMCARTMRSPRPVFENRLTRTLCVYLGYERDPIPTKHQEDLQAVFGSKCLSGKFLNHWNRL